MKKHVILFASAIVLLGIGVISCNYFQKKKKIDNWEKTLKKHIEYHDNGQPSLVVLSDTTTNEKFFNYFYRNGNAERDYLKVDGKIEGTVSFYYPTGEIEQKHQYIGGLQNGFCQWYYEDGSLKDEIPYINGKRNGKSSFYNKKGKIKAQNAFIDDKLYWKLVNTLDSTGNIISTYETYKPIVELNRDTLIIGDTVLAHFTIPFEKTKFDQSSILKVKYDMCLETDSLPEPRFRINLEDGKGEISFSVDKAGLYFLFGYLTSDHNGEGEAHEYFIEEYVVLPSGSRL